ncbi:uncharacterized protein TM35_000093190 [Trypanosoma theileri]|uniref:Uncharacterized protein n=1 Tax=Trypanosoma theileri TaxID=67003 RepID=A0A1X0P166_9TRYP|nr:uncharacterized protein TM35_000093190 [Trypanosoma theileri]ORC90269.1 hypothetical protein TM35_000093190 [Trypanosoma theileri]
MCLGVKTASQLFTLPLKQALPVSTHNSLHIRYLSSLQAHHQRHIRRLASLVKRGGTEEGGCNNTLVACSVVAQQRNTNTGASPTDDADVMFCATGVNHALHRRFNAGRTLRGILKGCAEQNALGVAAASGHCYSAITDVYLYATTLQQTSSHCRNIDSTKDSNITENPRDDRDTAAPATTTSPPPSSSSSSSLLLSSVKGAVFPCPECWRSLMSVAAMRHDDGETEPLNLFVHVSGEGAAAATAAVRGVSVARESLSLSPLSPIDVTIVLAG